MDVQAYLARIGYTGPLDPTLSTLRAIHRAHLLSVPFENLDIRPLHRQLSLELPDLYEKIVVNRRGGFCFEQNGLFSWVLHELGFDVSLLQAEVQQSVGNFGVPFNHLALLVQLEGERWLTDIGFGDNFTEPLHLDDPDPQQDDSGLFRVGNQGEYWLMERYHHEKWEGQYRFFLPPRQLSDFAEACDYMQHSPNSPFTQKRLCSQLTSTGRKTISNFTLILTEDGQRTEKDLEGETGFANALQEYFGITL